MARLPIVDRALGLVVAITIAACSNKPNASGVPEDSGESSESSGVPQDSSTHPDDAQHPDSGDDAQDAEGPPCVPDGGFYACLGGAWPTCPIAVYEAVSPFAGCDFSVPSCFRCDGVVGMNDPPMVGTGATCNCRDAGYPIPDGSTGYWDCVGTGFTCQ
jgi:hypothetical protein